MASKTIERASKFGEVDLSARMLDRATVNKGIDIAEWVGTLAEQRSLRDRVQGAVMWNAAWHYVAVDKAGAVGAGGAEKGRMWETQQDYMAALGFSKAYGTILKRLARCVDVHGVMLGTPEWAFLTQNAQVSAVGKIVALDDKAEFRAALKTAMAELKQNGRIAVTRAPRTAGDGTDESGAGEESGAGAGEPQAREATLDDILRALDVALKGADREAFADAETRIQRMLAREVTIRAKQDKADATA